MIFRRYQNTLIYSLIYFKVEHGPEQSRGFLGLLVCIPCCLYSPIQKASPSSAGASLLFSMSMQPSVLEYHKQEDS